MFAAPTAGSAFPYTVPPTAAQQRAVVAAGNAACSALGRSCAFDTIEVAREHAHAPHGVAIRGWASASGQVNNCQVGCLVQVIVRRVSTTPLRYRSRLTVGPSRGFVHTCFQLFWHLAGGNSPTMRRLRALPGVVVFGLRPGCFLVSRQSVEAFYGPTIANPDAYARGLRKPRALCVDLHICLTKLRWSRFARSSATATGHASKSFAGGTPQEGPVTITFTTLRASCDTRTYTRYSMRFEGRRITGRLTRLGEDSCQWSADNP